MNRPRPSNFTMKLMLRRGEPKPGGAQPIGARQAASHRSGSAVIVILAMLAILFIYISANLRTLHVLDRELKLIQARQLHRLQVISLQRTNSIPNGPNHAH